MKEKIEEILLKHSPYVFFGNAVKTELFGETVKHLTTLIQEERKEAVEGLLKWFEGKKVRECFKELNDKYTGEEYIETTEGYHYLQGFVEEYLESEGKE
jgi:hypothetical protein